MLFITLITLIICKALLNERLSFNFSFRITSIILLLTAFSNYNTLFNFEIVTGIGIYNGLFHITYITQIIEIFLLIIGSIILISWPLKNELITEISQNSKNLLYNYVDQNKSNIRYSLLTNNLSNYPINYSIITLFCTLGASLLISCSDLISMYLSIELQSFSLYVLSTLYKNSEKSTSAGLKYFLLGALSSCLILFGAGLIYAYTGLTNLESIYSFLSVYSIEINNNLVQIIYPFLSEAEGYSGSIFLGFIFIFVGFLFKISAAPFHNWSPAKCYGKTLAQFREWEKLPNSGNALMLLIPNSSRKAISGWGNHSCMVTSQKIDENKMGNRGSKSDLLKFKPVKEQRVDGSWCFRFFQKTFKIYSNGFRKKFSNQNPF